MFERLGCWEGGAVHLRNSHNGARLARGHVRANKVVAYTCGSTMPNLSGGIILPAVLFNPPWAAPGRSRGYKGRCPEVRTNRAGPRAVAVGRAWRACREGVVQKRSGARSSGLKISRQSRLRICSRPHSSAPKRSLVLYHSDGNKLQALLAVHLQPLSVRCQSLRHIVSHSD
jgi:hypothetical protein